MLFLFQIKVILQAKPKFRRGAKVFTESQSGICGNSPPPFYNLTYPGLGNSRVLRQFVLGFFFQKNHVA